MHDVAVRAIIVAHQRIKTNNANVVQAVLTYIGIQVTFKQIVVMVMTKRRMEFVVGYVFL
jgi:hypothetical protein